MIWGCSLPWSTLKPMGQTNFNSEPYVALGSLLKASSADIKRCAAFDT